MNDEILEQIDKLKLMYLMEQAVPHKSAVEMFDEWVDELLCRHPRCYRNHEPFGMCTICDPKDYAEYRTVVALVEDLYHQKFSNDRNYQKDRKEIQKIISQVVAMTIYVQEKK